MAERRILVADDDAEFLQLAVRAVRRLDFEVVTATWGGDLLDKIADDGPFDLVITDVSMPWMTGVQVMQSARSAGLECPVIVMTALRDHETSRQIRSLGVAVQVLYKPFSIAQLEAAIDRAFAGMSTPPVGSVHR